MCARRVVVTGVGAVSPLGLTVASTWAGVVAGRSGAGPITLFDPRRVPRPHRRRGAAVSSRRRSSAGAGPGIWTA